MLPQKRLVCRRNPFRIFEYLQLSLEEVMLPARCFSAWASGLGDSVDKPSSVPFCLHLGTETTTGSAHRQPVCISLLGLCFIHSRRSICGSCPVSSHRGFKGSRDSSFDIRVSDCPNTVLLFFFTSYCRNMVPQMVKNPPAKWENWVGKIPWRRARQPTPTPVFLSGESPWREEPGGPKSRTQLSD